MRPVTVTASVTNTGPVAGAEVVQVYLGVPVAGTAAQATRRLPEGVRGAGRVKAGDDHHRPGGDEPPVQRLGLLQPTAS